MTQTQKECTKERIARKAASWWADHLRHGALLDNGDDSETGAMTMMLGRMSQRTFSSEDAQKFEDALTNIIMDEDVTYLGVDYHPCKELQDAGNIANISFGMTDLPWKTFMQIKEGKITASLGYRAELQEI